MQIDNLTEALALFAITGILSAPYVIGFKDPERYPRFALVWGLAGLVVSGAVWAYSLGYHDGSGLTSDEVTEALAGAHLVAIVAITQSALLLAFDTIYMMEKRMDLSRKKRIEGEKGKGPQDHI